MFFSYKKIKAGDNKQHAHYQKEKTQEYYKHNL
jgi:hypothetical protein